MDCVIPPQLPRKRLIGFIPMFYPCPPAGGCRKNLNGTTLMQPYILGNLRVIALLKRKVCKSGFAGWRIYLTAFILAILSWHIRWPEPETGCYWFVLINVGGLAGTHDMKFFVIRQEIFPISAVSRRTLTESWMLVIKIKIMFWIK